MWIASSEAPLEFLENVFSILRFRSRGVVSFRRFVVMYADDEIGAHDQRADAAVTQPMRIMRC